MSETTDDTSPAGSSDQWRGSGSVVVLSRDVFFGMRIRTSLRHLGYEVAIAQDIPGFTKLLTGGDAPSALGLIDFNNPVDWPALADAIASGVPIVAFGPHIDVSGFRAAKSAGVSRVVANGEFSRSLPALAKRHARPGATRPN